uniref:Uncharacterized protein n=1 Tax=Musa balbisiana TaxID=52838 RepID=Q1EP61_MUSBA|nr:hypothetical protein MBP_81C12.30 [Musa balbisiana]
MEGEDLVVKEAKEVENLKTNFKYQEKVEGQRPENFIRSIGVGDRNDEEDGTIQRQPKLFETYSKKDFKVYEAMLIKAPTSIHPVHAIRDCSGSKFDYSTTTTESSWKPRDMLHLKQKIKDSTNVKRCSVRKGFDKDVDGISGGEYHGQSCK